MKATIIPAWLARKLYDNNLPLNTVTSKEKLLSILSKEELFFYSEAQSLHQESLVAPVLGVYKLLSEDVETQVGGCDWLLSPLDMEVQYNLSIGAKEVTPHEKFAMVFGDIAKTGAEPGKLDFYNFEPYSLEPDHVGLVVVPCEKRIPQWVVAENVLNLLNKYVGNERVFQMKLFDAYLKTKP